MLHVACSQVYSGVWPESLVEAVKDVNERAAARAETALERESGPLYAALAAFALAYVVSRGFASVFECTVDTVFVCAVRDSAEYGGVFMSDGLRDALQLEAPSRGARGGRGAPPAGQS